MFATKGVLQTAQKALKLTETSWRGAQPAWLISCDKLELVLTKHGLNIASVTHVDDPNKLNPFWVPKWPWKSPTECPHLHIKGEDEAIYGNREDSQLLTNICGHSICIDRFGICKLTDEPRTCHGEAPVLEWQLNQYTNNTVSFSVNLPLAKLHLKRAFNFEDDVVYVTTYIENMSNRFVDFFEPDNEHNTYDDSERKETLNTLTTYTVNEMKEDLAKDRNIGNMNASSNMNMNASSFMNLSGNKAERKKTKSRRDSSNLQRTYEIVRSFMEDEYRIQHIDKKTKKMKDFILSPRDFILSYQEELENDPNQNEALNDEMIKDIFDKKHNTQVEAKDEDLALSFKEDDRTRYDVEWTEHITISDPFLNDAEFILPQYAMDTNVAYHCPLPMTNSRFNGKNEIRLDECVAIPKENEMDVRITEASACIVDDDDKDKKAFNECSFIVRNDSFGYELEYEWNAKTFPWLCIWTEHYGTEYIPWSNKERCRGLEISTKPFPIPDLHKHLAENEMMKHENNDKIHCWNGKPIAFVLPNEGKAETFALRWSPIKK